jgi:hypothetical protein
VWEWFTDVFQTRMSKNSGLLVVCTRWHVDDLLGRYLDRHANDLSIKVLRYPAVAEDLLGRYLDRHANLPKGDKITLEHLKVVAVL